MPTDAVGPLHGVRVLDASRVLAGPLCGQILGDLGAEVLKVERPGEGDETRAWGPPFAGSYSAYYLSCNRNKRGLTLDLSKPDGLKIFYQLAERSDVLVENFRAASTEHLGVSSRQLHAINPRLIVCSISGFGRTGPMREVAGYDLAIQALSGFLSTTGPSEGPPSKVGVAVVDILTGQNAAIAILACLHARQTSGHGYAIDLSLLDCAVAAQINVAEAYLVSGKVSPRQGNAHLQIVPYEVFRTGDHWLVLAVGNDGQWRRFCTAAARPDLAADERFLTNTLRVKNRTTLIPMLHELLQSRSTAEWVLALDAVNVPHAPVWDYAQLFASPQATARGLRVTVHDPQGNPIDLIGSPFHIGGTTLPQPSMPPALGQHTAEVLRELLGIEEERLTELRQAGVIG